MKKGSKEFASFFNDFLLFYQSMDQKRAELKDLFNSQLMKKIAFKDKFMDKKAELEKLQRNIELICQENNSLQEENKLLREDLEAEQRKMSNLQDGFFFQKKEIDTLNMQIEESTKQLQQSNDLRSMLEREKEKIKSQLHESIVRDEEKKMLEMNFQNSLQQTQTESEIEELKRKIRKQSQQLKTVSSESLTQLEDWKKQIDIKERYIQQLQEQNDQLHEQLKMMYKAKGDEELQPLIREDSLMEDISEDPIPLIDSVTSMERNTTQQVFLSDNVILNIPQIH